MAEPIPCPPPYSAYCSVSRVPMDLFVKFTRSIFPVYPPVICASLNAKTTPESDKEPWVSQACRKQLFICKVFNHGFAWIHRDLARKSCHLPASIVLVSHLKHFDHQCKAHGQIDVSFGDMCVHAFHENGHANCNQKRERQYFQSRMV